ncbi:hypothetical protein JAAARDRAFT_288915 [Jaapia argillacea MUCL 33604]|uniref:Copper-fist domain-containing protein n=1 Tax=Jaapia argillacea MUCL 33604 TaxID=933084 RepID=A0A067PR31_9AGAM|nr:hypothetical protein JAAARDRAFT_288915 [Jaapia argillacea MUCL 33604]
MVSVEGKKYSCETCIKGHRASSCKHHDRPLFEIKKKGRPVTQCEHCRELRKTKQIHVKCLCDGKQDAAPQVDSDVTKPKKGSSRFFFSRVFRIKDAVSLRHVPQWFI